MNAPPMAVNVLWGCASLKAWHEHRAALRDPACVQRRLLLGYVRANRSTVFGRAHGFAAIQSVEEYQRQVPASTYDDLQPLVGRVARGEPAVLTEAPVDRLAPSSGSTAAIKLIPFTSLLRREFSRAIDPWLVDLFRRHPTLLGGPAYWSITPAAAFVPAGFEYALPVGFDDDSMYLGGWRQALVRAIMAVPAAIRLIEDTNAFRYVTLLFLLRAREIRLISIWHPSFLDGLLDSIEEYRDRLILDIARGTFSPPGPVAPRVAAQLMPLLHPDSTRAAELRAVVPDDLRALWPRLSLISCWADGPACGPAEKLQRRRTGIQMQAKGLMATEGVVTIPFEGRHPVAIRSHFFEFVEPDGSIRLVHELSAGMEYTVLLTTGGGLYRYQLADRVRVDGFVNATPSLRFVGRDDRVSDWVGEKLSDGFVATVVASLFSDHALPRFAMLAPEQTTSGLAYTLFVEADRPESPGLAQRLETALRRNPHYAWCVDLGQLRPARVVNVGPRADLAYLAACTSRGGRLGNVKPVALDPHIGWGQLLPCADRPPAPSASARLSQVTSAC